MTHFYFQMAKKYVVAFSHLINDVHVQRLDSEGALIRDIRVPITFAGKSKMAYVLEYRNSTQSDSPITAGTILPRIGFIMTGMTYDATRRRNALNEIPIGDTGETFIYSGNPYNFTFDVAILAKNQDDLMQIVEQISTQFSPDVSLTVNEIPELGIQRDVSITLDDVNLSSSVLEFSEEDDRVLTADMTFTLRGFLYRPSANATLIEAINTTIKNSTTEETIVTIDHQYNELTEDVDTTVTEITE